MTRLPVALAVAMSIGPVAVFAQSMPSAQTEQPSEAGRIQFGARGSAPVSRPTHGTDVEFARFGRSTRDHGDAVSHRETEKKSLPPRSSVGNRCSVMPVSR